ncbi:MAG TPA: transposase [Anaerovoracaceae bacterium]|nr:transposase [Anaerovoracaceae bacterium]
MRKCAVNQSKGQQVAYQIGKIIHSGFPGLSDKIMQLSDPRKHKEYSLAELVMGGIMLFVFKEGSRNAFDNDRKESSFRKNYKRVFKLKLPSADAVEDLYRVLDNKELESLKSLVIKGLIERKVFHRFRFMGKRYFISIDGTGVAAYKSNYCGECTSKTSKNGVTTYFHNVLEAKLVTSNDMSVSIATEWVQNENGKEYDKQDCELKAFKRLAVKLKKMYPRLPIVILADSLYANQTFFKICKDNGWEFIVTFKDGNLPSVHQEIGLLPKSAKQTGKRFIAGKKGQAIHQDFQWVNNIEYCGFNLSVVECKEVKTWAKQDKTEEKTFTHISSMPVDRSNYYRISDGGRMRWKIENSFDYLKEHGYNLGHKFSRVSFVALKNYYQSMMLAHAINQFVEKSTDIVNLLAEHSKCTIVNLWKRLLAYFTENEINQGEYDQLIQKRYQVRLE